MAKIQRTRNEESTRWFERHGRTRVKAPSGGRVRLWQMICGKITSNASGGEKYNAKSLDNLTVDISASGNLAQSELGTLAASDDCLVLNLGAVGGTGHTLAVGSYFEGRLARINSDGKKVVHVYESAAGGSTSNIIYAKTTSADTLTTAASFPSYAAAVVINTGDVIRVRASGIITTPNPGGGSMQMQLLAGGGVVWTSTGVGVMSAVLNDNSWNVEAECVAGGGSTGLMTVPSAAAGTPRYSWGTQSVGSIGTGSPFPIGIQVASNPGTLTLAYLSVERV